MITENDQMVIIQWNANGILERITTPPNRKIWIEPFLDNAFKYTTPSPHGKVAIIFVSDVILFLPWDTIPPIPLLVYTVRKDHYETPNFYVIPNPYDLSGFSERNVKELLSKVTTTFNLTRDIFERRRNILMWRGGNHGEKIREIIVAYSKNEEDNEPVWIDAKWSFGSDTNAISEVESAAKYRYHLDVGGVSGTSWEGLRWKMCSGNLVFRIESDAMDWWHNMIQPWKHYIPVKEDLSDLRTQYDWVENHPDEVYDIAQRGQKVCFETYQASFGEKVMKEIIESLPAATYEQIQQVNEIFDELYKKENNNNNNNNTIKRF
jgi:hypothetical protein